MKPTKHAVMDALFIFGIVLGVLLLTGTAQAATEDNGFYFGATSSQPAGQYQGIMFIPNENITVWNITKTTNATSLTNAIITNSAGTMLTGANTSTTSGDKYLYSGGINLTKGITYFIGLGHSVTFTNRYSTGGLPKTGTIGNWTLGAYGVTGFGVAPTTDVTNTWNVQSIDYTIYTTPGLPTTYFSITASDIWNSTSLTTFNATINGTTYTTTNGTITTTINASRMPLVNITGVQAYRYFNTSATNVNTSNTQQYNLTPWGYVRAKDIYDNTTITTFDVLVNSTTYNSGSDGVAWLPIGNYPYNATVNATNYLRIAPITNGNGSNNVNVSLWQSEVYFNATEIISGNAVTGFTVNTTNASNNSATPLLLLKAGTYNITLSKTGWFNKTQSVTVTAGTNTTTTFTDVYAYIINITATNTFTGTAVTNFSANVTSGNYTYNVSRTTTTGNISVPWTNDTNINITLYDSPSIGINSTLLDTNTYNTPVWVNTTVTSYTTNSIIFYIYDETNGTLLNGTTVTLYLTSDAISYNYTTGTGTLNATLLSPEAYTINYGATGYNAREYIYTLTNQSTTVLNLYLLATSEEDLVRVTILDTSAQRVQDAIVKMQKKNLSSTNYYTVEMCNTDILGQCLLHANLYYTTYQFLVEYDGETKLNSGDKKISNVDITFIINLENDLLQQNLEESSITGSVTYTTGLFTYTWNDIYNNLQTGCLVLERRVGTTTTNSGTANCSTSSTSTVTASIDTTLGDEWIGTGVVTYSDGRGNYTVDIESIVTSDFKTELGTEGLYLFGFILLGTIVFVGLSNPVVAVVLLTAGVYILNALQFISIGVAGWGAVLGLAVIVLLNLRKT